ncbi:SCP2 sterol-binding domain-containing protein [Streptomyces tubercidicus]
MNSEFNHVVSPSWLGAPIDARPLFVPEQEALMGTLRGLAPAEWGQEAVPGWTHRQQIRHAAGQDTDPDPRPLSLVLDTFMRALPHTLREVAAPSGTQIQVRIDGPAGGVWTVTATGSRWSLAEPDSARPAAAVRLDTETVWRLCTRGIQPDTALARARIEGDRELGEAACQIVSVIC